MAEEMKRGRVLRRLQMKDAERMLEWMHDETIADNFRIDFSKYTIEQVEKFIEKSFDEINQHFAIVDESDIYQGTISLKNISEEDNNAEYAIVMRADAQGKGYSAKATKEILEYAFKILGLHRVYLNVLENNVRARKFYEKMGFKQEGIFKEHYCLNGRYQNLWWYGIVYEK